MPQQKIAKQAKDLHKNTLLSKQNVTGVGVGYKSTAGRSTGEFSVVVMVQKKLPVAALSSDDIVPRSVNGVKTDVLEVGELRAFQSRIERWRPVPGGVSIGHYQITAGTLGGFVHDKDTGDMLLLSNNHIFANINQAFKGDPILQPGPADGGRIEEDIVAFLERFVPIEFTSAPSSCSIANTYVTVGNALAKMTNSHHRINAFQTNPLASNLVDAAVAKPIDGELFNEEIMEIGTLSGTQTATLGMAVRKSGRTTALRTGEVNVMHATVSVSYGSAGEASFEDQIVTSPISQGGDSGSLLVAVGSLDAVGLVFAGSNQASVCNPIQTVLDALNVEIKNQTEVSNKSVYQTVADRAQRVKEAYEMELMSKANVVGVGVGLQRRGGERTDDVGLVVMVTHKVPPANLTSEDLIPSQIEGVPVDVKVVGEIKAQ